MAEHNCSVTNLEGATAPSSASSGAGAGDDCPSVEDPPGTATCEVCGAKYGSGRGLSQHQRSRHPEWYHERKGPAFVRPGWTRDEMVLLVRGEVQLVRAARQRGEDGRVKVDAELARRFPTKKKDSIVNVRKTQNYRDLRARLETEIGEESEEEIEVRLPAPVVGYVPVVERGSVSGGEVGTVASGGGWDLSPTPGQVERQRVTPEPKDRKGPKIRWGEELLEEVAREELRLSGLNTRFMNAALRNSFPSRTLEAIKGMRRKPKYKLLLASLCAPNPAVTPPGPSQSEEGTLMPEDEVRCEGSSHEREYETPTVSVHMDMPFTGPLQPMYVEGDSPPNVALLPEASDSTKGGRPEIVLAGIATSSVQNDSVVDFECDESTLVPAEVTLDNITLCNDSVVEISSIVVDTPPRREVDKPRSTEGDVGSRDEGEVEMPMTEPDDREEESEPSSQPCNPRQGDVSQTVGDGGGRAMAGQQDEEYAMWEDKLREELVCAQGYLAGMDSLEFMDFQPGQLSREHREMLDSEYQRWVELELGSSHRRKGPRRRARRREAAGRKEAAGPAEAGGRRKRRRTEYARVQKLYRSNMGECSRKVLSGEWRSEESPNIPLEDQVVFWSRVFGEESVPDTRTVHPQGMVLWGLVQPITVEEIFSTLRKAKDGAVGLDKISRKEISKLNPRALQAHFNLWLYAGYQPVEFRHSRTVLIPKVAEPSGPAQFRPIAIGSFISRVFHRLLAERLSGLLEFHSRQRAFVKGDGIADNVFLLRCLLRDTCVDLKPMCLAFLDVSKAFDSVSHATLLLAAERMGAPGPFISYLKTLYSEASTVLHVDGRFSDPLKQNRGVRYRPCYLTASSTGRWRRWIQRWEMWLVGVLG